MSEYDEKIINIYQKRNSGKKGNIVWKYQDEYTWEK